jgi:phosphoribosylamine--glycine ligase
VAPGNGGTAAIAENVPIGFTDVPALLAFAQTKKIDLTVIGQEAASDAGAVDAFQAAGLAIFGPTKKATQIESSKAFSKLLMADQKIPTAAFQNFEDPGAAMEYVKQRSLPIVIKASGLAEGKGVVIAQTLTEAQAAIDNIMVNKDFGDSGNTVVIEDFLQGQEVSMHALCDSKRAVLFPASQDHKQVHDGDIGPNTGGMGVFAPVPWVTDQHLKTIEDSIVQPALEGMKTKDASFTGCLYPGLMIDGPDVNVVEFNARFGDPEAETYMRLFDGDLYETLMTCTNGSLDPASVTWKTGTAVTVALASAGYPGKYQKGIPITGLEAAAAQPDIVLFHAGTTYDDSGYKTAGGRVLYVTATSKTATTREIRGVDGLRQIGINVPPGTIEHEPASESDRGNDKPF